MREIFKGFLMLRLFAFIPMVIIIAVLAAVTRGSDAVAIVVLASLPVLLMAALGWLMTRRASGRGRGR